MIKGWIQTEPRIKPHAILLILEEEKERLIKNDQKIFQIPAEVPLKTFIRACRREKLGNVNPHWDLGTLWHNCNLHSSLPPPSMPDEPLNSRFILKMEKMEI